MTIRIRPLCLDDVPALTELLAANREHLAPWEPVREDSYFTVECQAVLVAELLARRADGLVEPFVIADDDRMVGRITLQTIVRGPFQSASLGYLVAQPDTGRAVATTAVALVARLAFGELGLHRLEAATLLHNAASQRVLERNGFVRFGQAPRYLNIAGRWQDHILFQRLADD